MIGSPPGAPAPGARRRPGPVHSRGTIPTITPSRDRPVVRGRRLVRLDCRKIPRRASSRGASRRCTGRSLRLRRCGPGHRESSACVQRSGLQLPGASGPRSRSASTTQPGPPPPSPAAPDRPRPSVTAGEPGDAARPHLRSQPGSRVSSLSSGGVPRRSLTGSAPGDEQSSARTIPPSTQSRSPTRHWKTTPLATSAHSTDQTPANRESCFDAMTPPSPLANFELPKPARGIVKPERFGINVGNSTDIARAVRCNDETPPMEITRLVLALNALPGGSAEFPLAFPHVHLARRPPRLPEGGTR